MCVYMHYLHIHAPPNTTKYHQSIRYTLLAFPLYTMKDQVKMRHLCWISCFCCFSGAFHVLFMKKCHFSWKPRKPGQYVCIHAPFTHTCTTNLPQNIRYTWLTFPLYYMKDQVKMRHLCWISCFCGFQVLFMCFWWKHYFLYKKCNFSWKLKTRSICVYTCTIYTYMHHQIPPKYKIYLVGLPSVHYERPGQNETSVLNQLFFVAFQVHAWHFHMCMHQLHDQT